MVTLPATSLPLSPMMRALFLEAFTAMPKLIAAAMPPAEPVTTRVWAVVLKGVSFSSPFTVSREPAFMLMLPAVTMLSVVSMKASLSPPR